MKNLIRKILKEEVNKKYPKPTPKVEQLVYSWLDNYFEGSQMYQNKSYEFSYTFEWCKNGKEVMSFYLSFNNDYDVWDDKRTTEERDFDSGKLQIPKEIVNELLSDIPLRGSYLKYLIEEWFEDTYLGEIQNIMKRTDISVDHFTEYPEKSKICVPPIKTTPEDVTEEDMIEHILKTTLFKRNDIIKHEEEKPGWIEKTYLQKLRSAEYDRLNRQ